MDIKIMVCFNLGNSFSLNQSVKTDKPLVFMVFQKPRTLSLKPPDKNRKIYLNQASY